MRRLLLVLTLLLSSTTNADMGMTLGEYRNYRIEHKTVTAVILSHAFHGIRWSNAFLTVSAERKGSGPVIFCPPDEYERTATQILDAHLALYQDEYEEDDPVTYILLKAARLEFPCGEKI